MILSFIFLGVFSLFAIPQSIVLNVEADVTLGSNGDPNHAWTYVKNYGLRQLSSNNHNNYNSIISGPMLSQNSDHQLYNVSGLLVMNPLPRVMACNETLMSAMKPICNWAVKSSNKNQHNNSGGGDDNHNLYRRSILDMVSSGVGSLSSSSLESSHHRTPVQFSLFSQTPDKMSRMMQQNGASMSHNRREDIYAPISIADELELLAAGGDMGRSKRSGGDSEPMMNDSANLYALLRAMINKCCEVDCNVITLKQEIYDLCKPGYHGQSRNVLNA